MYDIIMLHKNIKVLSNQQIFNIIDMIYPDRKIYSLSIDWRKSKEFILKARGINGDVIVGWRENNIN